ncbi:MAG: redoxin domain-containing protein, partial [Bacteroidota bacterium]|nr:redoxin domain-containing protein [Bacteroidota bacterium]
MVTLYWLCIGGFEMPCSYRSRSVADNIPADTCGRFRKLRSACSAGVFLIVLLAFTARYVCAQSTDERFNSILTAAAGKLESISAVRLTVESCYVTEGNAGPVETRYTIVAQRADSLWTGCNIFGRTSEGAFMLFDGARLLEGRPASGRMTSYAAVRQPQHRIANVLSGWELAPIPRKDNVMREILNDEHITQRLVSRGTLGTDSVLVLASLRSIGGGITETLTEWHLRTSDLFPLKVAQHRKMVGVPQTSDEIWITSVQADPYIQPGLFSGASLPDDLQISEASRPVYPGSQLLNKGDVAPDFEASALQGGTYALSDLKGRVVFLDFFYADCLPCHRAIPTIVKMYEEFADRG